MQGEQKLKQIFHERSRQRPMLNASRLKTTVPRCSGVYGFCSLLALFLTRQVSHHKAGWQIDLHLGARLRGLSFSGTLAKRSSHVPANCCHVTMMLPSFQREPENLNFKHWSLQHKTVSQVEATDCWFVTMWLLVWRIRWSRSQKPAFSVCMSKILTVVGLHHSWEHFLNLKLVLIFLPLLIFVLYLSLFFQATEVMLVWKHGMIVKGRKGMNENRSKYNTFITSSYILRCPGS